MEKEFKGILLICRPELKSLFTPFRRVFRMTRVCDRLSSAIASLRAFCPEAIITEPVFPDGEVWSLATAVQTGKLCRPDTPIILLTFGEHTPAVEQMAKGKKVHLFGQPTLEQLPGFVEDILQMREADKPAVLIIEDDPDIAREICYLLSPWFQTEVCLNGQDGLDAWIERSHDLIILDLHLPDMHGVEVLRHIRRINQSQAVLILTAHLTEDNIIGFSLKGAYHFADKAVLLSSPHEFLKKCQEALDWHGLLNLDGCERGWLDYIRMTRAASEYLARGRVGSAKVLLAAASRRFQLPEAKPEAEDDDF